MTLVTMDPTTTPVVEYSVAGGPGWLNQSQNGTSDVFTDGGSEMRTLQIHRVMLTGLTPGATYREFKSRILNYLN